MKFIGDSVLDGLKKFMAKGGIDFVTATEAIRNDNVSSVSIPDGEIFRFVLQKKYRLVLREDPEDYTIITSDKELPGYCRAFGIECILVEKPETRAGFKETAARLVGQLAPN
jgi:hypothetical protein